MKHCNKKTLKTEPKSADQFATTDFVTSDLNLENVILQETNTTKCESMAKFVDDNLTMLDQHPANVI